MRTIRIVAVVIAIAFLAFLSLGLLKPKVSVQTTVQTTRDAATLFHVLTDADRLSLWMTGFVSIDPLLQRDENVGSRSRLRMLSGKDTLVVDQEKLTYDFGKEFRLSMDGSMFDGELRMLLTPVENGTELHVTTVFEGTTWYWRSLFPLITSALRSTQDGDYERLIDLVEVAPSSIIGEWTGTDSSGSEQFFQFMPDSEVIWQVAIGGESLKIDGIRWQLDDSLRPMKLDLDAFTSGPLKGMALYAIVEFVDNGEMQFDAEVGISGDDSVRPTEFTDSSIRVHRVQ